MGILKTKGIIIAESNMNDFDKMLTILTPNGKIGCAAKGARRPKSVLMAATQFLCFGEYMLYNNSQNYNINSCDIIEIFYKKKTCQKVSVIGFIGSCVITTFITDTFINVYFHI